MPAGSTNNPADQISQRISVIDAQLLPPTVVVNNSISAVQSRAMPQRTQITCHVLDTTTGRPAPSLSVKLILLTPDGPSKPLTAATNSDGRVTEWSSRGGPTLEELFDGIRQRVKSGEKTEALWTLQFDTGTYYKQKSIEPFFPEVTLTFAVRELDEHYHVPLLLGPYNYTTYRGS